MHVEDRLLIAQAARRMTITGSSFKHSMRRETMRRRRQIEAGKISASPVPISEVDLPKPPIAETPLPAPGASIPEIPTPTAEIPADPTPVAETAAEPASSDGTEKKTKARAKKIAAEPVVPSATSETASAPAPVNSELTDEEKAELEKKTRNIGRRVTWSAFGKALEGEIAHVIPPRANPRQLGIEAGTQTSPSRDHFSYVIRKDDGALVWPKFSDLRVVQA